MSWQKISEKWLLFSLVAVNLVLRFFRIDQPGYTIFDETKYYIPSARAILSGEEDPNFEHPPLAKILLAISMQLFGDNPLGWRTPGVIASVVAVAAIYFLAKRMLKSRLAGFFAALLLTIEFSWFSTSRVAIPEIIMATFGLITFFFAYRFYQEKKGKDLVLAGLLFGAALASKWSILLISPFLVILIILAAGLKLKQLVVWLGIFVVSASLFYLTSYSLFLQKHSLADLFARHRKMYEFHTKVYPELFKEPVAKKGQVEYKAWAWPINSIYTYGAEKEEGKELGNRVVILFYHPLILWGSLILVVLLIKQAFLKRKLELNETLLLGGFLIFWLVWLFSPRVSYPYYWIPGIPFAIILLAGFLEKRFRKEKFDVYGLLITSVVLFIFYYPMLSFLPLPDWYLTILTGFGKFN